MNKLETLYSAMQNEISQYKAEAEKDEPSVEALSALEYAINSKKVQIDQLKKVQAFEQLSEEYSNTLSPRQTTSNVDLVQHMEKHNYSFTKAIQEHANGRLTGLEQEVQVEQYRQSAPRNANALLLPFNTPLSKRWASLSTSTGLIPTHTAPSVYDVLLAQLVAPQVGVQSMGNLAGIHRFPKATVAVTPAAVAEGNSGTASSAEVGSVSLQPRSILARQTATNMWVNNSSFDGEAFLVNQLIRTAAVLVDRYIFSGTNSNNQPKGILYDSDVATTSCGTNGGALDWTIINNMIAAVDTGNALASSCAFVFNPRIRSALSTTVKVANQGGFILENDSVAGFKAVSTTQLPANLTKGTGTGLSAMIFGDFSRVMWGTFGPAEILINPYVSVGNVEISYYMEMDCCVVYPEGLNKVVDALA